MEQFKKKFLEEANELVAKLEISLLSFELDLKNKRIVEEIFRIMHTFKGTSAMFGFENISEFTHYLESIYAEIRDNKISADNKIIELSFEAIDVLKLMISEDKNAESLANKVLAQIKNFTVISQKPQTKIEEKMSAELNHNEQPTYYIIFMPDTNINESEINFIHLFSELDNMGLFSIVNHVFPKIEVNNEYDNEWGIYLSSSNSVFEIKNFFNKYPIRYSILQVSKYNLFFHDEFIRRLDVLKKNPSEKVAIQKSIMHDVKFLTDENDLEDTIFLFSDEKEEEESAKFLIQTATKKHEENVQKNTEKIQNLSKQITSRVSVESDKLDKLMYLVSELIINKAEFEIQRQRKDFSNFDATIEKLDKLSRQFRDITLSIRLVPINDMIMRFQRLIRDLSKDLGKEVNFITQGTEIELDKNVIDNLGEPIMHIIRNSLDHGIEMPEVREQKGKMAKGKIEFSAYNLGANVVIKIKDDGKGIDKQFIVEKAISKGFITKDVNLTTKEIYDLIFLPGFSTAQSLTEVSGRGVGMDIVRKKIADLRGEIVINSEKDKGTEIIIKIPISLSILDALLVRIDTLFCLIPLDFIDSCQEESHEKIMKASNSRIIINQELIPFIYLRSLFGLHDNIPSRQRIVIIHSYGRKIALIVDEVLGEHQAVLKSLGELFKDIEYVSGGSILGSGDVAMVLDTNKLVEKLSHR